jgi:hypothetical protein
VRQGPGRAGRAQGSGSQADLVLEDDGVRLADEASTLKRLDWRVGRASSCIVVDLVEDIRFQLWFAVSDVQQQGAVLCGYGSSSSAVREETRALRMRLCGLAMWTTFISL